MQETGEHKVEKGEQNWSPKEATWLQQTRAGMASDQEGALQAGSPGIEVEGALGSLIQGDLSVH